MQSQKWMGNNYIEINSKKKQYRKKEQDNTVTKITSHFGAPTIFSPIVTSDKKTALLQI